MRLEICHDVRLTSLVLLKTATGLLMTAGQDLGYTFHLRWEMLFAGRGKKNRSFMSSCCIDSNTTPKRGTERGDTEWIGIATLGNTWVSPCALPSKHRLDPIILGLWDMTRSQPKVACLLVMPTELIWAWILMRRWKFFPLNPSLGDRYMNIKVWGTVSH